MRAYRTVSLCLALVLVAFVGVAVEGSLMSARQRLQTAVAPHSSQSFTLTLPTWAR